MRLFGPSTVFLSPNPAECYDPPTSSPALHEYVPSIYRLARWGAQSGRTTATGVSQVYCLYVTHRRVRQVAATLIMGPKWPQTMLFHDFTGYSRQTNAKGWSALLFKHEYVI